MSETLLLADIGGTYIRFAIMHDGAIQLIRKYYVSESPDIITTIERYLREVEHSTYVFDVFAMSSAAVKQNGVWSFTNHNPWIIDPKEIMRVLPVKAFHILDDFGANAYGLINVKGSQLHEIRPASTSYDPSLSKCIAGCGTGLGLSYLIPFGDQLRVHETWGGHMLPVTVTEEQREILDMVQKMKTIKCSPIFEDVASGPGFSRIYHILKQENPGKDIFFSANDILTRARAKGPVATHALRLFHEFLGLYLHQAVMFTHSYGGVYLTGGFLDAVFCNNLFDLETVLKYFHMQTVPVVDETLRSVPIYWIRDEYMALRGVYEAYKRGHLR